MYEGSANVRVGSRITLPFEVNTGVRQGVLTSPLLLLIVLHVVLAASISCWRGICLDQQTSAADLDYADDAAHLAESVEDM